MNEIYTSLMQGTDKVLVNPKVITIILGCIIGLFSYYQYNKDQATQDFRGRQLDKMDDFIEKTGELSTGFAGLKTEVVYIKEGQAREEKQRDKLDIQITSIKETLEKTQKQDDKICDILDGLSITYSWQHGCTK